MANVVDNGLVSPEKVGEQPGAPARTRTGKPAGPAFKPMHREDMDPQEFAAMLDAYDDSFRNIAEGEVVKGTVLKVTDTVVVVDVGYKSEGLIQIDEFLDENGQITVQAGDVLDVLLERTEDREGHIVLSREKAEKMKSLGRGRKGLHRSQGRDRPGHRAHQGRPRGRHRRCVRSSRARRSTCGRSATSTR